jgi:hypothetical protein
MKYWYYWNIMAEKKAVYSYRVEEIDNEIYELIKIGGFNVSSDIISLKSTIMKNVNSRKHSNLCWEDLKRADSNLSQKIYNLSLHYGYSY